ncbi:unnamed protein product [Cylindrotheca closterium]|uniref:Arrestin C-terminal-like domain-containing protein n=1 Tax=Cylindrotheca closterium TaxID=2856 RepID=A0AAD2G269_9STRA|nr:unnamed protein product [Cylindrotheca closterium]
MGNKYSITITLDNGDRPAVAGKTLKGNVILKANRRLHPNNLVLYLIGKENTIITKATKGTRIRDYKVIARAMTTLLDPGKENISKGIHTIPFSFMLPASLPSSEQFPKVDSRSFNGKIEYRLRAQLGDSFVERLFTVESAPLPSDIVPCMLKPQTYELKRLGFLNTGCLSIAASLENSRVGRGQPLGISLASRNDTSNKIVRVQLKLVELIEYRSRGEEATSKQDLEKLKDIDLPSLEKQKGENLKFSKDGFAEKMETTYRSIYTDLVSSKSQIDLIVPSEARDSYNGNLMTISHYVKVTFVTKAMIDNPTLKIPIVVGNAPPKRAKERRQRTPGTPVSTILVDEEIPEMPDDPCDESTITVGTGASGLPFADAIFLDEAQTTSLLDTVPIYPPMLAEEKDHPDRLLDLKKASYPPRVAPSPTAPDEAMLKDHKPTKFGSHIRDFDGLSTSHAPKTPPRPPKPAKSNGKSSGENIYHSPYRMYTAQPQRPMLYTFEDSDASTFQGKEDEPSPARFASKRRPLADIHPNANAKVNDPEPQTRLTKKTHPSRDAGSRHRLNRLIHELRGSIHDYEVIVTYASHPEYRQLFPTLTALELGIIMSHVNMNHQVKVARLMARQMSYDQAFTCAHCAEVIKRTSEFFRANMVEALLPFCEDLTTNRKLVQNSLSEWELMITDRLFDGLYEC